MRKTLEMYTVSRMQNMVHIRDQLIFHLFEKALLGLSAFRAPKMGQYLRIVGKRTVPRNALDTTKQTLRRKAPSGQLSGFPRPS